MVVVMVMMAAQAEGLSQARDELRGVCHHFQAGRRYRDGQGGHMG